MYFQSEPLFSAKLNVEKPIWVYLPPSYEHSDNRYPVIYMLDGQNLFDPEAAFGGAEWQVDETLDARAEAGLGEFIVIGLPAGEDRLAEYSPWPCEGLAEARGQAFAAFLTEELIPYVNDNFRTLPGPAHTAIVGSSMGALVALHAVLEHEGHFGTAGIFSIAQADCVPDKEFLIGEVDRHGSRESARRVFIYYGGQECQDLPEVSHGLHEAFARYPHHQAEIMLHPHAEHQERYWSLAFEQFIGWHAGAPAVAA